MKKFVLNIYFKLLGFFAKIYIKRFKPEIIGITGTIGKTSARMIVHQILEKFLDKKIYTSPKNFNGELGMVFSIFCIESYNPTVLGLVKAFLQILSKTLFGKKQYDIILLEYGVDHIGEMDFLISIVKPNIGIFTKIDKVHSLQFGNPDITAQEKFKLIKNSKEIVFLNYDDSYCRSIYPDIKVDKFYYDTAGNCSDQHDLCVQNSKLIKKDNKIGTEFTYTWRGKEKANIKTNLIGESNISYICLGFSILSIYTYKYFKKDFFHTLRNIEVDFKLQAGRLSFFDGTNDSIIVDSSYNSSPLSMKRTIEDIYKIKNELYPDYKLLLCLGDMRELGDFTEQEHRNLAKTIFSTADSVFLVRENMQRFTSDELIKMGYNSKNIYTFDNSKLAGPEIQKFISKAPEKYIILFKGGQNTVFLEEAIKFVLKNPEDIKLLPRQSDFWLAKKDKFFGK